MELKSLAEHNKKGARLYAGTNEYPRPNGIECPKCGTELEDVNGTILTSYPLQRNIYCPNCGYTGCRIA